MSMRSAARQDQHQRPRSGASTEVDDMNLSQLPTSQGGNQLWNGTSGKLAKRHVQAWKAHKALTELPWLSQQMVPSRHAMPAACGRVMSVGPLFPPRFASTLFRQRILSWNSYKSGLPLIPYSRSIPAQLTWPLRSR